MIEGDQNRLPFTQSGTVYLEIRLYRFKSLLNLYPISNKK